MRINNVKLYNFSSYRNYSELDLSISPDRNIVLIGGQNGSGKTSLFTAIKLALYGPLCFGFQGKNNQYTTKIKDLINHDAFAQELVNAYIEIEITLLRKSHNYRYTIHREWTYCEQKLNETVGIFENGALLSEEDADYFQNYLYTLLPPNLFEFFFFDGEEVSSFFVGSSYKSYLKNAIFTLESFDNFECISKFCKRYVKKAEDVQQYDKLYAEYDQLNNELEEFESENNRRKQTIATIKHEIDKCSDEINNLQYQYSKMGGLSKGKRMDLEKKSKALEKRREQINYELRNYIEGQMPLILTAQLANSLKEQIELEDEIRQYEVIKSILSSDNLLLALPQTIQEYQIGNPVKFARQLSSELSLYIKPDRNIEDMVMLHDLSQEQRNIVFGVISSMEVFSSKEIIDLIQEKESIIMQSSEIRKTLDASMSEEEAKIFEEKISLLKQQKTELLQSEIVETESLGKYNDYIEQTKKRCKSLRGSLSNLTRSINAEEYTEKIHKMMNHMLHALIAEKRNQIASSTLSFLHDILRKEHFIDFLEIEDDFKLSLFRECEYAYAELSSLITNIGTDDLIYRIGNQGITKLMQTFRVDSIKELKNVMKDAAGQTTLFDTNSFLLYKRIELHQLSKGEKQIFIMALYWSIIKTANKNIPFIIDTPFARIDMEHRKNVIQTFFPKISDQVIIFSTDEEINGVYYDSISPYVAREFTLTYDEAKEQTEVTSGYFTGGQLR